MKVFLAGATLALALTGTANAQLVAVKTLSGEMTATMLLTAVKCAKSDKLTVAIVDRSQVLILSFRGPTAAVGTVDIAVRKANAAAQFGVATGTPPAGAAPGAPPGGAAAAAPPATLDSLAQQLRTTNTGVNNLQNHSATVTLGGAEPIKVGDEVIGAISLSGLGAMEDPCAKEAIASVQGLLK